jgi:hypothetical protein
LIVRGSNFVYVNAGISAPASQSCKKGEKFIGGAAWFPGLSSGDETRAFSLTESRAPVTCSWVACR